MDKHAVIDTVFKNYKMISPLHLLSEIANGRDPRYYSKTYSYMLEQGYIDEKGNLTKKEFTAASWNEAVKLLVREFKYSGNVTLSESLQAAKDVAQYTELKAKERLDSGDDGEQQTFNLDDLPELTEEQMMWFNEHFKETY